MAEFAKLYDAYFNKLYRFCYFKLSNQDLAQDIVSDTFLKALEKIKDFKQGKGTFQAWLFTIARNKVIDYYRKKDRHFNVDDFWGFEAEENLEDNAEIKHLAEMAKKQLSLLNDKQREVVILKIWHELSYQEIARIVGKSEGACKMIFSRTVEKLKDSFYARES